MQDTDVGYSWCVVAVPPALTTASAFEPVFPVDRQTSTGGGDQRRSTPAATVSSVAGSKPTATGDVQTTSTSTSSLPLSVVTEGAFCEARVVRKVEWPRTAAGRTAVTECPNNKNSKCYVPDMTCNVFGGTLSLPYSTQPTRRLKIAHV